MRPATWGGGATQCEELRGVGEEREAWVHSELALTTLHSLLGASKATVRIPRRNLTLYPSPCPRCLFNVFRRDLHAASYKYVVYWYLIDSVGFSIA